MPRRAAVNVHIVNGVDMRTIGFRNPGLVSIYDVLIWLMAMYCFGTMIYTAHMVDVGASEPKSGNRPVWILLCPVVLGLGILFLAFNGVAGGAGIRQQFNYFRLRALQLGWQIIWTGFTCAVGAITTWKNYAAGCFNHTQTDNSLCIGAPAIGPICAFAGLGWILIVVLHTYLHVTEQNYQQLERTKQIESNNARMAQEVEFARAQASQRTSQVPLAHVAAEPVHEV